MPCHTYSLGRLGGSGWLLAAATQLGEGADGLWVDIFLNQAEKVVQVMLLNLGALQ